MHANTHSDARITPTTHTNIHTNITLASVTHCFRHIIKIILSVLAERGRGCSCKPNPWRPSPEVGDPHFNAEAKPGIFAACVCVMLFWFVQSLRVCSVLCFVQSLHVCVLFSVFVCVCVCV
jgi:hypothetical protein